MIWGRQAEQPWLKRKEWIYFMTLLTGGSQSNTRAGIHEWECWHPQTQSILRGSRAALCTHLSGAPALISPEVFIISELWFLSQKKELKDVCESTSRSLQTPLLPLHRDSISQNRGQTAVDIIDGLWYIIKKPLLSLEIKQPTQWNWLFESKIQPFAL